MLIILLWLKKFGVILKILSLKILIEPELLSIRIFLVNVTLTIGQEEYLLLILFWKLVPGHMKLKT